MIHTYQIEGITLQTGDIICTMNGKPDILPGEFWRLVGRLVPGDVDHIAIYLGPDGRCIEAGHAWRDHLRCAAWTLGYRAHGASTRTFV